MARELLELFEIETSPFRKLETGTITVLPTEQSVGTTISFTTKEVFIPDPVNNPTNIYDVFRDGKFRYIVRGEKDTPQNRFYIVDPKSGVTDAELSTAKDPFRFLLNPQNIAVNKSKLVTEFRTRRGYEIQHWGPQISEITWTGVVPLMKFPIAGKPSIPTITGRQTQVFTDKGYSVTENAAKDDIDITLTEGYKFFQELQDLYDKDQNFESSGERRKILALKYRRSIYIGYLRDFSWTEAAEKPRLINYSITFRVQEIAENLNEAFSKVNEAVFRNLETIRFLESDFAKL